jgi:hypothetical protein
MGDEDCADHYFFSHFSPSQISHTGVGSKRQTEYPRSLFHFNFPIKLTPPGAKAMGDSACPSLLLKVASTSH